MGVYLPEEGELAGTDDINTPRFSERIKESQKEQQYFDGMRKIGMKRRQAESKKALYNSLNGKHRQSMSSNSTNHGSSQRKLLDTETSCQGSKPERRINHQQLAVERGLVSAKHRGWKPFEEGGSKAICSSSNSSSNHCLKLNIDLREQNWSRDPYKVA